MPWACSWSLLSLRRHGEVPSSLVPGLAARNKGHAPCQGFFLVASPVAFSLTWAQLDALRSLPSPVPKRGYPYSATGPLIEKGLADVVRGGVQLTPDGMHLLTALARLARPDRPSK